MRSSDRLLDIVEELLRRPGQPLTGLAQSLNLPKATVLRFLRSLEEREWVQRLPDGAYEIGPQLGSLTGAAAPCDHVLAHAERYLLALRDAVDESVGVQRVVGRGRECVLTFPSSKSQRFVYETAVRRDLHVGASGKVLLAFGSPSLQSAVLREPLAGYTPNTTVSAAALRAELDTVRAAGWAMSHGERCAGSVAFAVPLRDPLSGRVHSLTVLAPQERFSAATRRLWLDELQHCAADMEAAASAAS